jgi:hypothetical protein
LLIGCGAGSTPATAEASQTALDVLARLDGVWRNGDDWMQWPHEGDVWCGTVVLSTATGPVWLREDLSVVRRADVAYVRREIDDVDGARSRHPRVRHVSTPGGTQHRRRSWWARGDFLLRSRHLRLAQVQRHVATMWVQRRAFLLLADDRIGVGAPDPDSVSRQLL